MSEKHGGYMGRVLKINLTDHTQEDYPWSEEERELFLGGKIMASKILCDLLTGKEKPFSEENPIVITTGPFTGTGAPSSSRFNLSSLSPQTGFTASSNCGGNFGWYLKKAGLDALILVGKCETHTWLEIKGGKLLWHDADADGLWGLRVTPAEEKLRELLGEKAKYGQAVIGPAGENLVLYSCVMSGERAAGRAGIGAVFGSKNLKAVTVSGVRDVPVAEPEKNKEWNKKWFRYLRRHPLTGNQLPRLGTAGLVSSMQAHHMLATRNYQSGTNPDFEKVNGEVLAEEYNLVNKGCLTCPIKCARTVTVDGKEVKGPELETLGLLGGGIQNDNMENILKWNHELDELGLDTISCAGTIAYAMEANEKGLWANSLSFGKTDGLSEIFEDIAYRRGLGDELAEGSRKLSEKYGGKEFAIHAKGLELAAYEPRGAVGQGLGYAVSNRGGCHLNGGYLVIIEGLGLQVDAATPKAKADFTMLFQDLMETISASGQCLFTSYAFFPAFLIEKPNGAVTQAVNKLIPHIGWLLRFINRFPTLFALQLPVLPQTKGCKLVTGFPLNFGRYVRIGERGYTLERMVNEKFGVSEKDDRLPDRLTKEPQNPDDPTSVVPLDRMKKTYYKARMWDENGHPTEKCKKRLKLL